MWNLRFARPSFRGWIRVWLGIEELEGACAKCKVDRDCLARERVSDLKRFRKMATDGENSEIVVERRIKALEFKYETLERNTNGLRQVVEEQGGNLRIIMGRASDESPYVRLIKEHERDLECHRDSINDHESRLTAVEKTRKSPARTKVNGKAG